MREGACAEGWAHCNSGMREGACAEGWAHCNSGMREGRVLRDGLTITQE